MTENEREQLKAEARKLVDRYNYLLTNGDRVELMDVDEKFRAIQRKLNEAGTVLPVRAAPALALKLSVVKARSAQSQYPYRKSSPPDPHSHKSLHRRNLRNHRNPRTLRGILRCGRSFLFR